MGHTMEYSVFDCMQSLKPACRLRRASRLAVLGEHNLHLSTAVASSPELRAGLQPIHVYMYVERYGPTIMSVAASFAMFGLFNPTCSSHTWK